MVSDTKVTDNTITRQRPHYVAIGAAPQGKSKKTVESCFISDYCNKDRVEEKLNHMLFKLGIVDKDTEFMMSIDKDYKFYNLTKDEALDIMLEFLCII